MKKRGRKFKLTEEQRKAIPQMLKRKSTRQVAYWLGVSQRTVWLYSPAGELYRARRDIRKVVRG